MEFYKNLKKFSDLFNLGLSFDEADPPELAVIKYEQAGGFTIG
ncbi:MAG TPA: hypothetical protein VK694_03405 [Verrucomicrobiae bacterium]|nr:hypothetical protein [Verrucomicrobiae bacterium]